MGEITSIKSTVVKRASCGHANVFNQPYPYHAGFSDLGFLYNDKGNLTLIWSCYDPAFEAIVGKKNPWALTFAEQRKLEDALLPAPSGGRWRFSNSARCQECSAVISDPISRTIYFLVYDNSIQTLNSKTHDLMLAQQLRSSA